MRSQHFYGVPPIFHEKPPPIFFEDTGSDDQELAQTLCLIKQYMVIMVYETVYGLFLLDQMMYHF